jgi:hypothetical protein
MTDSGSIIISESELVKGDEPIPHVLGVYDLTVPFGKQFRVFKDGKYKEDLTPGRHRWVALSPFVRYTASIIDTREHMTAPIPARGTIPGQEGMPSCHIEVMFKLTYQLADIDKLLETVRPLRRLESLATDHIATLITQLRYDQQQEWVTRLRDELQRHLRLIAAASTGLAVSQVLIDGEPKGQNDADRALLRRYNVIQDISIDTLRKTADRQNLVADSESILQAATTVGINPADLAVTQLANADKLLAAQVLLQETRTNAGDWSGTQSILPQAGRPSAYIGPASMPVEQARISAPYVGPTNPGPSSYGSDTTPTNPGSYYPTSNTTPPPATPMPTPIPAAEGARVSEPRLDQECARLRDAHPGMSALAGPSQFADAAGALVNGAHVIVFAPENSTWRFIRFDLYPTYPATAPRVSLALNEGQAMKWTGPALDRWSTTNWLSDLLGDILQAV